MHIVQNIINGKTILKVKGKFQFLLILPDFEMYCKSTVIYNYGNGTKIS